MTQGNGHFDEMTALLYLEGQLDAVHAGDIEAHVRSCAACRELLHALETEGVWLREALVVDDESIPASVIAAPEKSSAHWGWWAAFALIAFGAYSIWTGFVEPWVTQASSSGFTQGNFLTVVFFTGAFRFWKGWGAMLTLMEIMALATLAFVGIWLLRRHWQRFTAIAFVMGGLAVALSIPQPIAAQSVQVQVGDVQTGNPVYTLPAGQEVKTDLRVVADRAQIDGDVDGDLLVAAQYLTVNGHVKGDILAFAQEVRINGPVDGNVRLWCQAVTLNSSVAKNVMVWSQAMELDSKGKVGGTITTATQAGQLNGEIDGDVLVAGEVVDINGSMGHDVSIHSERLNIGPAAEIKGQTKYEGRRPADVSPGAKLAGPIAFTYAKRGPNYSQGEYYYHRLWLWGASFLLALAIILVAPAFFFDVTQACKKVGPAMGFGALFLFATPIAAIIVCATIVGLSVGLPVLLLYAIAVYSAKIFVGAWLGERILGESVGIGPAIGRVALGLLILRGIAMIPFIGGLVGWIIVPIWGLGAIVLVLHRRIAPHAAATVAAAA
jgi:cytoskeletal protein CcmA (bactofilin family)